MMAWDVNVPGHVIFDPCWRRVKRNNSFDMRLIGEVTMHIVTFNQQGFH